MFVGDEQPIPTPASQPHRDCVEGPSNHQQLLQGEASFAKLSKAHGATVSGLTAPSVVESQTDKKMGPSYVCGGKKWISLSNLTPSVEQLNGDVD